MIEIQSASLAPSGLKSRGAAVEQIRENRTTATANDKEQAGLQKACRDFEAIFIQQMLKEMRESIPKDDLFGGDKGEETFKGMLDETLAQKLSEGGGLGLADMLYRTFSERTAPPAGNGSPPDALTASKIKFYPLKP